MCFIQIFRSGRPHNAQILSLWGYSKYGFQDGIQWKTYVISCFFFGGGGVKSFKKYSGFVIIDQSIIKKIT